ncbi:hypothetical protein SNEBB_006007 [Seison nebaliae]|nr:hypothetical protein SNEBB_006007 [Seison nebaliae]
MNIYVGLFTISIYYRFIKTTSVPSCTETTGQFNKVVYVHQHEFARTKIIKSPYDDIGQGSWLLWIKEPVKHICLFRGGLFKRRVNLEKEEQIQHDVFCKSNGDIVISSLDFHHLGIWTAKKFSNSTLFALYEFILFTVTDTEFQMSISNNFRLPNFKSLFFQNPNLTYFLHKNEMREMKRKRTINAHVHQLYIKKLYFSCSFALHCGDEVRNCLRRLETYFIIRSRHDTNYKFYELETNFLPSQGTNYRRNLKYDFKETNPKLFYRFGTMVRHELFCKERKKPLMTQCDIELRAAIYSVIFSTNNPVFKFTQVIKINELNQLDRKVEREHFVVIPIRIDKTSLGNIFNSTTFFRNQLSIVRNDDLLPRKLDISIKSLLDDEQYNRILISDLNRHELRVTDRSIYHLHQIVKLNYLATHPLDFPYISTFGYTVLFIVSLLSAMVLSLISLTILSFDTEEDVSEELYLESSTFETRSSVRDSSFRMSSTRNSFRNSERLSALGRRSMKLLILNERNTIGQ